MSRVVAATLTLIILFGMGASVQAQNVLETIENILSSIEDLKSQVETIAEQMGTQAEQLTSLDETLEKINSEWPQIQQSTQFIESLRSRLEPILEKWPEVESALENFDVAAGELTRIRDGFGKLESRIEEFLQISNDEQYAAMQSEISALRGSLNLRDERIDSLQISVSNLQLILYVLIGIIVVVLVGEVILFRRLRRPRDTKKLQGILPFS